MRKCWPTTTENLTAKLFLRFLLCYAVALALATFALKNGLPFPLITPWKWEFFFVVAALAAFLLTVCHPVLLLLTTAKGFYDAALFWRLIALARTDSISWLWWNAGLVLLLCSLPLFCFAAARACYFAHLTTARDLRLIFSRLFLRFLAEALILTALSLPLLFVLPRVFTF